MHVADYDPANLNRMISMVESIRDHRIKHPVNKSDEMYYRIIADYFTAARDAEKMGRKLVYHSGMLPTEIFYAMDIVPCMADALAMSLASLTYSYEVALATGKAYGFAPETCSQHRLMIGIALNGWLPKPDAIVWSSMACDNTAKINDNLRRLWGCPSFFVDRGYYSNERELAYFSDELKGTIEFLERLTGRTMDYDRLSQCLARTHEVMQLQRELAEFKKAIPAPMRSRTGMIAQIVGVCMHGTQQAVDFFRQLRDEAKERVDRGEGVLKEEKYRLLLFYEPPHHSWKIVDWLERAHNAVIVDEPTFGGTWGRGDFDPSNPLQGLAGKTFIMPGCAWQAPIEPVVEGMVQGAKDYSVDGVLTFTHVGCRQGSACNRRIKDAVAEATGLPFFSIEHDIADPAFVSEEEMRDKLEGFFEMIDERRG